jgi:hypothetical protein
MRERRSDGGLASLSLARVALQAHSHSAEGEAPARELAIRITPAQPMKAARGPTAPTEGSEISQETVTPISRDSANFYDCST